MALLREKITRDINDVNKTWTKKIKSMSEAYLRDKEGYLPKRRTSNGINTTQWTQQRASQTNVTENNANK